MKVLNVLDELNIQAVLVTNPYNMRYISGFRGGEGVLYISKNQRVLITDSRYTEAAKQESNFTVLECNQQHSTTKLLKECIDRDQATSLGYEDTSMICKTFATYQKEFSSITNWVPLDNKLNALRQIKTEEEIGYLRQAEHIGDLAFAGILDIIKPGMTELEIQAELEYLMMKNGASGTSFDTIVASGVHSSMPHAIPTHKKIEYGDFITMDFGCKYMGYCSDMTRTIVVGKANEEQRRIYNLVLRAQKTATSFIHAGMICMEVDKIARDIIRDGGYGDCFGHGLGHSVGLEIHESPACNTRDRSVLAENMIMTVEPGIYVPGFGGVRIEDMIVVRKSGIENLAASTKELIEL